MDSTTSTVTAAACSFIEPLADKSLIKICVFEQGAKRYEKCLQTFGKPLTDVFMELERQHLLGYLERVRNEKKMSMLEYGEFVLEMEALRPAFALGTMKMVLRLYRILQCQYSELAEHLSKALDSCSFKSVSESRPMLNTAIEAFKMKKVKENHDIFCPKEGHAVCPYERM